jgi:hypothetical protein
VTDLSLNAFVAQKEFEDLCFDFGLELDEVVCDDLIATSYGFVAVNSFVCPDF